MCLKVLNIRSAIKKMRDEPSQDIVLVKANSKLKYAVLVLADGVSEAVFSHKGAEAVAEFLQDYMYENHNYLLSEEYETYVNEICVKVSEKVSGLAENFGIGKDHFASTLCGVIANTDENKLFYFSLGDSIIFAVKDKCVQKIAEHGGEKTVYTNDFKPDDVKAGIMYISDWTSVYLASDGFVSQVFEHGCESLKDSMKDYVVCNDFDMLNNSLHNRLLFDDCSYCCAVLKGNADEEKRNS